MCWLQALSKQGCAVDFVGGSSSVLVVGGRCLASGMVGGGCSNLSVWDTMAPAASSCVGRLSHHQVGLWWRFDVCNCVSRRYGHPLPLQCCARVECANPCLGIPLPAGNRDGSSDAARRLVAGRGRLRGRPVVHRSTHDGQQFWCATACCACCAAPRLPSHLPIPRAPRSSPPSLLTC